jgi:hypothetical protein
MSMVFLLFGFPPPGGVVNKKPTAFIGSGFDKFS